MVTAYNFYQADIDTTSNDDDLSSMDGTHSDKISSSRTTNGSLSFSDDENSLSIDKTKSDRIKKFLRKKNKSKLIKCANTTGFINIINRQQIWPLIIPSPSYCSVEYDQNKNAYFCPNNYYSADEDQIESHRYYRQVRMDVERTLKRFPANYAYSDRLELQEKLIIVIIKILIKHDHLYYYQGYHDICLTFLLVLGTDLCLPLIDTVTKTHIREFMAPTMEKARDLLFYLMPLINSINNECAEYMQRGGVGNVMFALSWFITWYSHVLDNLDIILRLYDLFIVSHPLMPIYVAAEIVNFYADQVLSIDCDMASLHQYLTHLPSKLDSNNWEEIIKRSIHLIRKYHPNTLDILNDEWKKKCEHIDSSSMETFLRRRYGKDKLDNGTNDDNILIQNEHQGALPRIVLWGVTLTISGLAIYIWSHTQRTDPTAFISLGDFLAQLYGN